MQSEGHEQAETPDDATIDSQRAIRDHQRWSFRSPTPVYAAGGEQIGVLSLGSPGDFLIVQRDEEGPDLAIPLSAVNRSDNSGVYLSLTRADLADERWLAKPAEE